MLKTITQLWNGNLEPLKYFGQNNPEMKELERLLQRNGERLGENLSEKAKEIFERYNDCVNEDISLLSEQALVTAFALGQEWSWEF